MFIDLEATRGDHEEVRTLIFYGPFHTCVNDYIDREREGCDNAGREAAWSTTTHS
jgi:hypothetical protein